MPSTLADDSLVHGDHGDIGASVARQLEVPLVVVDRRAAPAWANGAARALHGAVGAALFDADARAPGALLLRSQLQDLVLASLRAAARAEALVEGPEGSWLGAAVPLQGHGGLVLLRLHPLDRFASAELRERLHRLFGLSEAEAQVTLQLAGGASLEAIARARGVSVDTVRAQVRSVFHKTGIHRQGALICAVGRLAAG
jgi:DNA-binding CsgD family transcriptional regulator